MMEDCHEFFVQCRSRHIDTEYKRDTVYMAETVHQLTIASEMLASGSIRSPDAITFTPLNDLGWSVACKHSPSVSFGGRERPHIQSGYRIQSVPNSVGHQ